MSLLMFTPFALLGVLALVACAISLAVERAERRRARLHAPRVRLAWRFRPVVIEGGKAAPSAPVEDAPLPRRKVSS